MDKQIFCKKLGDCLFDNLKFVLNEKQKEQMFFLADRLLETNKVMNLTAIVDEDGIILRHIVDSLFISDSISEGASLIDVGCGAGFPSLPLAIFRPDINILSLDSTEKRIKYVEETASLLGLSNVRALAARAEDATKLSEYRERFDFATARAVASLPMLCELTLPFVKVGGSLVAMKAKDAYAELDASKNAISKLCGKDALSEVRTLDSALEGFGICEKRTVIQIKKLQKTPSAYPRKFAQIKKSPI